MENLIQQLHSNDLTKRKEAVQNLAQLNEAWVYSYFLDYVKQLNSESASNDSYVYESIITLVFKPKGIEALEPLLEIIKGTSYFLANLALDILTDIKELQVITSLIHLLREDLDSKIGDIVAGKIAGFYREVEMSQDDFEFLLAILKNGAEKNRSFAALALNNTKDEKQLDLLIPYTTDENVEVRLLIFGALSYVQNEKLLNLFLSFAQDKRPVVREIVILTLGEYRDIRTLDVFLTALQDEDCEVRSEACRALAKLGDARALPYLEKLAKDDKDENQYGVTIKEKAEEAIQLIKNKNKQLG